MKYYLLCLLIVLTLSAQNRGLVRKVYSASGAEVTRYSGSYALLIGVSDYTNGWPDLESVSLEIKDVKKSLEAKGFITEMVLNPDSDKLKDAYESFVDLYGYDDNNRLLFFYSGHGYSLDNGNKGYLVPTDAPNPQQDLKNFKRKSLNMTDLLALSRKIDSKHVLFLFDSCFSGTIFKTKALPEAPPYIKQSMAKPVRQFITAGSAGEEVPAESVFTPLFIDAIDGKADLNGDGYVTGSEVGMYLSTNVPKFKNESPQYGKIDDYRLSRGDFIFFTPSLKQPSVKTSSFEFSTVKPDKFKLTIRTRPRDAKIEISSIKERYRDKISLKKGNYSIHVSKVGYLSKRGSVDLHSDMVIDVVLEKEAQQSVQQEVEKRVITKSKMPYEAPAGTYIDRKKSLMWEDNILEKNGARTFKGAKWYCANLSLGGFNDWRVPAYSELIDLADYTKFNPAIRAVFKHCFSNVYWSSSVYAEDNAKAWYVDFNRGKSFIMTKDKYSYVRCVR